MGRQWKPKFRHTPEGGVCVADNVQHFIITVHPRRRSRPPAPYSLVHRRSTLCSCGCGSLGMKGLSTASVPLQPLGFLRRHCCRRCWRRHGITRGRGITRSRSRSWGRGWAAEESVASAPGADSASACFCASLAASPPPFCSALGGTHQPPPLPPPLAPPGPFRPPGGRLLGSGLGAFAAYRTRSVRPPSTAASSAPVLQRLA